MIEDIESKERILALVQQNFGLSCGIYSVKFKCTKL